MPYVILRRVLKWVGIAFAALLMMLALVFVQVWYFRPFSIDIFFERVFVQLLLKEPELLTQLGVLRQIGYRGLEGELADDSPAHAQEIARLTRKDLQQLHGYDRESLSKSQQLSYDVLDWYLTDAVAGERWMYHNYPVNQMEGEQSATPEFMLRMHPIEDAVDARHYNQRLEAFSTKFGGLLESLKLRESKGVVPPKFVITRVLDEMRRFIAPPPQENPLYTNLRDKLAKINSISPQDQTQLLEHARNAIDTHVYPAYRTLISFFEHLDETAKEDYGVWKLPDGDAYYDYLVQAHTTTSMNAQAVYDFGVSEVARIEQEMDTILRAQGLTEGSVGARVATLSTDPREQFTNDDAGRAQCLAEFKRVMDEMIGGLGSNFTGLPKLNVRVERMPIFQEGGQTGAYADFGTLDGSRPATFFVNLRDMAEQPKFGIRTLAYHEGVPGHLLQGTVANSLTGVPTFRNVIPFTAYLEGWGLYAERLGWEMGFEKDPMDNLGRLQLEILRAARLVVDTGIHRKHWTREQSIDYLIEKTGRPRNDAISEVERYFVIPGQALAYKVGMQKILDLRAEAQSALGANFDLRDFHRVVLRDGALPLGTLEKQVHAWIEARRQP